MKQSRIMTLTSELVAKVQRLEPDDGPNPNIEHMNDEDFHELATRLLKNRADGPLFIFAYGSLIWKPEFESLASMPGTLKGWHRSFCIHIERWRGTKNVPGLMMALDRGGSCRGVLYQLPDDQPHEQIVRLLKREMSSKAATNKPRWMNVQAENSSHMALAFHVNRDGHLYKGGLTLEEVAWKLARAAGHWGSGAEYLFNTVTQLESLGIHDRNLWRLQKMVAEEIQSL